MKTCSNCGYFIGSEAEKFCPKCGIVLDSSDKKKEKDGWIDDTSSLFHPLNCQNCGEIIEEGDESIFCPNCGAKLEKPKVILKSVEPKGEITKIKLSEKHDEKDASIKELETFRDVPSDIKTDNYIEEDEIEEENADEYKEMDDDIIDFSKVDGGKKDTTSLFDDDYDFPIQTIKSKKIEADPSLYDELISRSIGTSSFMIPYEKRNGNTIFCPECGQHRLKRTPGEERQKENKQKRLESSLLQKTIGKLTLMHYCPDCGQPIYKKSDPSPQKSKLSVDQIKQQILNKVSPNTSSSSGSGLAGVFCCCCCILPILGAVGFFILMSL